MGKELGFGQTSVDHELVLVGKLVDKQACPGSGDKHYGLVMKYKVVEVKSGYYEGDTIYVVHGAPELPRVIYFKYCGSLKSFEVGATHRLRLKEKLPDNPSPFEVVVDPYLKLDQTQRYLCLKVDPEEEDEEDGRLTDVDEELYSEVEEEVEE
jgi:hypothetical protein